MPPSEFTRERNALVVRLIKAGQAKVAARVKALPRPTGPVWAINRLAREERERIEQLIAAAEHMRAAQVGRRRAPEDLSAATGRHRAALAHLSERAAAVLRDAGLGASHQVLLRVETTLTAAAADPELRPMLRQGRLERELSARGFDVFAGEKLPPPRQAPGKRPVGKAQARRTRASAKQRAGPSSAVAEREARVTNARESLKRAQEEAAAQQERLETAERRIGELDQARREAQRTLAQAREHSKRAARSVKVAQREARVAERTQQR